jgi:hypothetical protein
MECYYRADTAQNEQSMISLVVKNQWRLHLLTSIQKNQQYPRDKEIILEQWFFKWKGNTQAKGEASLIVKSGEVFTEK